MNKKVLSVVWEVYDRKDDLPTSDAQLLDAAFEAVKNAYAPYSGFSVGAALLLENINEYNNILNSCQGYTS
jgi:cytidine deaminase